MDMVEELQPLDHYERVKRALQMLTDLAPPDEPRTWKVEDLLKHDDIVWVVTKVRDSRVGLQSIFGPDRRECSLTFLKGAVPLKLTEDK